MNLLLKNMESPFLQNDDDNDKIWRFMEKCTIVFSQFDKIPEMQCVELQKMSDDICSLMSIPCSEVSSLILLANGGFSFTRSAIAGIKSSL